MNRQLTLILLALGAAGCKTAAETPSRGRESFKIEYSYKDDRKQRKIILSFRNVTKSPICIGPENWPQNGILLNTGDQVWIESANKRFSLAAEQDYCPRCVEKVMPGAEHNGFFRYESFSLSPEAESAEKKLSFNVTGFSCR